MKYCSSGYHSRNDPDLALHLGSLPNWLRSTGKNARFLLDRENSNTAQSRISGCFCKNSARLLRLMTAPEM